MFGRINVLVPRMDDISNLVGSKQVEKVIYIVQVQENMINDKVCSKKMEELI